MMKIWYSVSNYIRLHAMKIHLWSIIAENEHFASFCAAGDSIATADKNRDFFGSNKLRVS